MQPLDSTEAITVVCGGCGSAVPHPESRTAEELVADFQEGPPICAVCAHRSIYSPRPPPEVWELIIGLPQERKAP